jgi:hypothetical protein
MLCVALWFGALPNALFTSHASKVQVFAKLGNNLLGYVEMTRNTSSQELQAYTILRNIQDQVANILKHEYLPARYLAIFVGSSRLTKPDFPFVKNLDLFENSRVLEALQGASRIDVMYDEVETVDYAKKSVKATRRRSDLVVNNLESSTIIKRKTLVVPELEVWSFPSVQTNAKLTTLEVFQIQADTFGEINLGPYLHTVRMCPGSTLFKANMADLVSCKTLTSLSVYLQATPQNTLVGIGSLVNLKRLEIDVLGEGMYIPSEIAKLSKLLELSLQGQGVSGTIPKEIGKLTCLVSLSFCYTRLSSSIPSEICQLSMLENLYVYGNPRLTGVLPKELGDLKHLTRINLFATPGVTVVDVPGGLWDKDKTLWKHFGGTI